MNDYQDSNRPNWESYAEAELAYCISTSEVTLSKAYGFFKFLQLLLPREFDWVIHCYYGISEDTGAPGELKLIINFPYLDEHILIKTTTFGINFIVRDSSSRSLVTGLNVYTEPHNFFMKIFNKMYKDYKNAERKNHS
jgi:hypothetical protein